MHLIFSILFPLSVIRLWTDPMGNRLWGGLILIGTFLFLIHLLKKEGCISLSFLKKRIYSAPLQAGAICLALSGFLLSIILNANAIYEKRPLSIILMVSNIASYSFCVMVFIIFYLTKTNKFLLLALSILTAVHVLALLGIPLYPWVKVIFSHTLGNRLLIPYDSHSVFRGTTTYGPFAALTAVSLGLTAIKAKTIPHFVRLILGAIAIIATLGCLSCPSKTGLIAFFTGFSLSLYMLPRKVLIPAFTLCLVLIAGVHFAASKNPIMRYKLGKIFPYFLKLPHMNTMEIKDFIPKIEVYRLKLYKRSLELWKTAPWFGIGPGQFNIRSGFKWQLNVHNLYLGILCENGLACFIPLALLFLYALKKFWGSITGVLLGMLAVIWCPEILIDHSLPFIIGTCWLLVWTANVPLEPAIQPASSFTKVRDAAVDVDKRKY